MGVRQTGLVIIAVGAGLLVLGLLVYVGALSWFGRLPGDIRLEGEHTRVYVPIVSMLLLSLFLSLAAWLYRRFL